MCIVFQGKKNPGTDRGSVKRFLDKVKKAKVMQIDRCLVLLNLLVFFIM
jgi:hypothetical protein